MNPAQYSSAYVGGLMRSIGKVTVLSVSMTLLPTAGLSCCAQALIVTSANISSNHPVFFMLPPKVGPNLARATIPISLAHKGLTSESYPADSGGSRLRGCWAHPTPLEKGQKRWLPLLL